MHKNKYIPVDYLQVIPMTAEQKEKAGRLYEKLAEIAGLYKGKLKLKVIKSPENKIRWDSEL